MSNKKYIIQHRRGTLSEWETQPLVPREGELVIELDNATKEHKFKIGDGESAFKDLKYISVGEQYVTQQLVSARPRVITVTLYVGSWNEEGRDTGKYYQDITVPDITNYSRLDLKPNANQLADFQLLNMVFVTENKKDNTNTIRVHSVGDKPTKSYTMQASIVETDPKIDYEKIVGTPVGTPTSKSDWTQTDSTQANYIDNKPTAAGSSEVFNARVENRQFIIEQSKNIYIE